MDNDDFSENQLEITDETERETKEYWPDNIKHEDNTKKKRNKKEKRKDRKPRKPRKKLVILMAVLLFLVTAGVVVLILVLTRGEKEEEPVDGTLEPIANEPVVYYSKLTGLEVSRSGEQPNGMTYSVAEAKAIAEAINAAPVSCIQMPNGLDGARPQAGLDEAGVVFEAIAEAGITRFAAIFQDPQGSAIGPVRSLRKYYLSWDTPFDCTVVHAGGEDGALQEVSFGYRHLSESIEYMWRTGGRWVGNVFLGYSAPNNLFTDGTLLRRFNTDSGFTTSSPIVWPRMLPKEAARQYEGVVKNTTPVEVDEDEVESDEIEEEPVVLPAGWEVANNIDIHYGSVGQFNPVYTYRPETNTYLRSYESGDPHMYYICRTAESEPRPEEDCGEAVQVEAGVVIVMKVDEYTMPHKRESVETLGSGEAWVFQNGMAIPATWSKPSKNEQIRFTDAAGQEIVLAPGRTWISAVPKSYGYVSYN